MQKVIVIGCPGSGKSTFSKALHNVTGLPLYHLDMMKWNADGTNVPKNTFMTQSFSLIIRQISVLLVLNQEKIRNGQIYHVRHLKMKIMNLWNLSRITTL